MTIAHHLLTLQTTAQDDFMDITHNVQQVVTDLKIHDGFCFVFVPHTTAGITINEHADPDVRRDIIMALRKIVPDSLPYHHYEGNSTAHIKASIMGSSVNVLIDNGKLALGTWQGIFLCEFDGPRTRKVEVHIR